MLLRKTIKWTGILGTGLIGTALWVSIPRWLPVVADYYLPEGVTLLSQPKLQRMGVSVDNIALKTESCTLANIDNFAFSYQRAD